MVNMESFMGKHCTCSTQNAHTADRPTDKQADGQTRMPPTDRERKRQTVIQTHTHTKHSHTHAHTLTVNTMK